MTQTMDTREFCDLIALFSVYVLEKQTSLCHENYDEIWALQQPRAEKASLADLALGRVLLMQLG